MGRVDGARECVVLFTLFSFMFNFFSCLSDGLSRVARSARASPCRHLRGGKKVSSKCGDKERGASRGDLDTNNKGS